MATDIAIDVPATADPATTRSWTRRIPLISGMLLVIALATWGVRRWIYSRNHVSTDNAQVDGHITAIAPRIAGFIDRVLVDENQHVRLGDTLVVLDRRDLINRLEQAEADLRNAQAAGARARPRGQAARAAPGHAGGGGVGTGYHRGGGSQLPPGQRRLRALPRAGGVQDHLGPAARRGPERARRGGANLEAARRQASAAGSQVSASGAALRGADARLASAQSAVDNARLQLSYATLLAPNSGVVAKRNAEPGALVQVGPEPAVARPGRECVGHRQPQGDAARQGAGGRRRRSSAWTRTPAGRSTARSRA